MLPARDCTVRKPRVLSWLRPQAPQKLGLKRCSFSADSHRITYIFVIRSSSVHVKTSETILRWDGASDVKFHPEFKRSEVKERKVKWFYTLVNSAMKKKTLC
ncbi:hypothetical protein Y032_0525g2923 [Ancylostoma ceylanicum]|uniref:Uncharacterized protein n=1 Tax=Ancylostoma ceylanicum TaxID=53326 RepID=A0A016WS26_9BILA|nr:hypothetical protein Y032_0525g2923 [Ancylostoma ceylanicum]